MIQCTPISATERWTLTGQKTALSLAAMINSCRWLKTRLKFDSWHHGLLENIWFEGSLTFDGSVTAYLWTQEKLLRTDGWMEIKALQDVLADLKKLKFVCSPSSSADGIMQSDYRWLAQPSGKITQKNLPWYLPWRSPVIEDGFGLYRTVVFHPRRVLSTHWPPPRSYAGGGLELGECSFSENSRILGNFSTPAHIRLRESVEILLDFIRLCWICAWILVKNEPNISGQISFIKHFP